MRRYLGTVLVVSNIAVFAAALAWGYANLSVTSFVSSLSNVSASSIVMLFGLSFVLMIVYGLRLACLLGNRWRDSQAIVMLGFGLNAILPFRLGEVAKITYARRFFGTLPERLLVATGTEKALDLGALTLLGLSVFHSPDFATIRPGVMIIAAVFGTSLLGLILIMSLAGRGIFGAWVRPLAWLSPLVASIRAQSRLETVWRAVMWSGLIWGLTLWTIWVFFGAALPSFEFTHATVICLVIALAIALPGTPAGLGVMEAGIVAYLIRAANAEPSQALALAVVYRLSSLLLQIPVALAIMGWNLFIAGSVRKQMLTGGRRD